MMSAETEADPELARFDRWTPFLHLGNYGFGVPAFDRLREAGFAVRGWRQKSRSRGGDYDDVILGVRVSADAFASDILAAAEGRDPDTIAWVVAGLRCPARPFCKGCTSCQTVTSPLREVEPSHRGWM